MKVRRAEPRDAAAIASVLRSAFAEYELLYTPAAFTATTPSRVEIEQRIREGPVWIAVCDDVVVGTVSAMRRAEQLFIRGMAVVPSMRGLGAAGLLLEHVECYGRACGCSHLELSTTPFLDSAIALYQRCGFRRSGGGSQDLFGTPLFTMTKTLAPHQTLEVRPMRAAKAPFSLVTESPAVDPETAKRHFVSKLSVETDPADVHFDLERGVDEFVVVDVRSAEAYARRHIPGAINLPQRSISADTAAALPKDKLVVTYCWGPGCNASTKAAARLSALGFQVKELIGGIEYWQKEGYAVEGTLPADAPLYG